MHLVTYNDGEVTRVGILGDDIVASLPAGAPRTMLELIQAGPGVWQSVAQVPEQETGGVPLSSVRLLPPISNPSKVMAIGLNYMDHCREQHVDPPKEPLIFAKFPTAIIGPGDAIVWNPDLTSQVDYEVELGVVIGRRAKSVEQSEALDYVFGYTVLNDVSARDLQFGDKQWVRGKSLDTFCPIGPAIVTSDEIPNPQALALRCMVNGVALQDSTTAEMIFGVAELVSFISRFITLEPGDVIATGTPYGVGVFRDPQIFLKDGDVVVAEIERIGRLENTCKVVSR
jgi:2-keto-4-pentenoate hydratase/2-oxohepta-3-ene-1,7-dioic acid hydratase in catechol pathway